MSRRFTRHDWLNLHERAVRSGEVAPKKGRRMILRRPIISLAHPCPHHGFQVAVLEGEMICWPCEVEKRAKPVD